MQHARTSLFGAAAFWTGAALAQGALPPPDNLDLSWNGTGTVLMPVQGMDVQSGAMTVQPDGRILLAGRCQEPGDAPDNPLKTVCMARLLPSGVRDLSFGPGQTGVFAFSQFPSFSPVVGVQYDVGLHALLRQADGKIFVAGDTADNTGWRAMVARLLADGTLDPSVAQPVTFEFAHNDANPQSVIIAAAQQADGKIVVAGYTVRAGAAGGDTDVAVARLRPDLTLDPSFNGTGIRTVGLELGGDNSEYGTAVAIQGDGKIVVAGVVTITATDLDVLLLRFNADGTRDTSFGNNGAAWFDLGRHLGDAAFALRIDSAGRLWIAGQRQYNAGTDSDMFVARVLADGSALDTGFNGNGYRSVEFDLDSRKTDVANDLLLQSDGKIVLIGSATTDAGHHFAAARLLPDGTADSTFGTDGTLHGAFSSTLIGNEAGAAAFGGSGIVMAGRGYNSADGQFGVAMLRLDLIFKNGFEP